MSEPSNDDMSVANELETADEDSNELIQTAGARLLAAREARQLDLRGVAEKTRQSQDTLAALESMETAHIPASILRLQARNYARFLGLPEDEIASEYAQNLGPAVSSVVIAPPTGAKSSPHRALLGAGLVVLAVGCIAGLSLFMRSGAPENTDPLAISARLAPAYADISDLNDMVLETGQEFGIYANKRAWIEVRGSDGTVFRNREMSSGEAYFPRTGAGWTITVRDGGAFEWRLGEIVAAPVGDDGQALYSVSVDGALDAAIATQSAAMAEVSGSPGQRR